MIDQPPRRGMKAKTIRQILRKKINEWADSIEDENVAKLVRRDTIVTGGCIASMLLGEQVNDYDVYLRTHEAVRAVADYYVARFQNNLQSKVKPITIRVEDKYGRVKIVCQSAGVVSDNEIDRPYDYFEGRPEDEAAGYVGEVMQDPGDIEDAYEETEAASLEAAEEETAYRPVFLSTNAITLSGRVQVILRFYGEPDEIHENYDFVHCTSHYEHAKDGREALKLRPDAMQALLSRELRYVGSKYPICSLIRLRKFIKRGWTINAGQILKIVWQVNELDLGDIKVLEDQLTGVDVAYFTQLVNALRERDPDRVNAAYLVEILDRMF